jgi:hypothetical protein
MKYNAKRFHGAYEGNEERRTQEMQDAGMIKMDRSAVANLPQGVEYRPWPKSMPGVSDGKLDDTIESVDNQQGSDKGGMHKEYGVHKW